MRTRSLALLCLVAMHGCASRPTLTKQPSPHQEKVGVICQTKAAPVYPREALANNVTGDVVAIAHIVDGRVLSVKFRSGPEVFYDAVSEAQMKYRCEKSETAIDASEIFSFRTEWP